MTYKKSVNIDDDLTYIHGKIKKMVALMNAHDIKELKDDALGVSYDSEAIMNMYDDYCIYKVFGNKEEQEKMLNSFNRLYSNLLHIIKIKTKWV